MRYGTIIFDAIPAENDNARRRSINYISISHARDFFLLIDCYQYSYTSYTYTVMLVGSRRYIFPF